MKRPWRTGIGAKRSSTFSKQPQNSDSNPLGYCVISLGNKKIVGQF
jgi:hypothetical protein